MKKKILAVVMLVTMIFSLTACTESQSLDSEPSGKVESSKNTGKDLLKSLNWEAHSELGIGFYLPNNDAIKIQYKDYSKSGKTDCVEIVIGSNYEYGKVLLIIRPYDLENAVVSEDSIEFIVSGMKKDIKFCSETDKYYLYQKNYTHARELYLFPKGTSMYYRLETDDTVFEDFTDNYGVDHKAGDFFTEETYTAFKDSLTYLGE